MTIRNSKDSKSSETSIWSPHCAMTKIAKQSKAANTPMPRGSKPGERRGGRQRGTPNKKTALRNAAISAAIANPEISPLEFLLGVMRDPNVSAELRIKVAQAAAPFVHAKPGIARSGNTAASVELIDDPTDLSGYGPQQARNDERPSPPHPPACERRMYSQIRAG
jgi:hypothetical protein